MQLKRPYRKLRAAIIAAALGIPLAGCASSQFATLKTAGQDFPQAEFQVLGKTKYDQIWIDKTIEAEVAGFGFKRPARRPPGLDSATIVVQPVSVEKPSLITAIKKKLRR